MMDLDLEGKVALVTGASQGIGRGICLELAREGANVALCARRQEPLNETKAAIEAMGVRVLAIAADVTDREEVKRIVDETLETFGRIDMLVNNAGGGASGHHSVEDSDDVWQRCYDINLWPCIRFTRHVFKQMKEQQGGNIINVSSVGGRTASWPGISDYNSAKAALLMLTKSWALDFAPHNIRVNAVNPAFIRTPLWEKLAEEFIPEMGEDVEEVLKNLTRTLPLGRTGRPEEVGTVVAFLASDKTASFVTGVCWDIDGGYTRSI